jgi:DnaD/phage-associated family protein
MAFKGGFPRNVKYTPVPNPLFDTLLGQIDDLGEMKCTLRVIWILHQKKGHPRFVSAREITSDPILVQSLCNGPSNSIVQINSALKKAVDRGTLLTSTVVHEGEAQKIYTLNTLPYRKAVSELDGLDTNQLLVGSNDISGPVTERPNIFSLYESNIGTLNPMIAEQLKEAEENYPEEWIVDAFKEAVSNNVRNWRYVSRILERWEQDGRTDGGSGRHPEKAGYQEYFRR